MKTKARYMTYQHRWHHLSNSSILFDVVLFSPYGDIPLNSHGPNLKVSDEELMQLDLGLCTEKELLEVQIGNKPFKSLSYREISDLGNRFETLQRTTKYRKQEARNIFRHTISLLPLDPEYSSGKEVVRKLLQMQATTKERPMRRGIIFFEYLRKHRKTAAEYIDAQLR